MVIFLSGFCAYGQADFVDEEEAALFQGATKTIMALSKDNEESEWLRKKYKNYAFVTYDMKRKPIFIVQESIVTGDNTRFNNDVVFSDWQDFVLLCPKTASVVKSTLNNWVVVTKDSDEIQVYLPARITNKRIVPAGGTSYAVYTVYIDPEQL